MVLQKIKNKNLKTSLENKKLPKNIILEGEINEDLLYTSKLISMYLFCENSGCFNCKTCQNILNNNFDNIKFIEKYKNKQQITIDQIIELKKDALMAPINSDFKIFIIKDAKNLNVNSQNALLKIIEDCSFHLYFIFLVNNKTDLLETIVSRCSTYYIHNVEKSNFKIKIKNDFEENFFLDYIYCNYNCNIEFLENKKLYSLTKDIIISIFKSDKKSLFFLISKLFKNYKKNEILDSLNYIKIIIYLYINSFLSENEKSKFLKSFFDFKLVESNTNKLIMIYEKINEQICDFQFNLNYNITSLKLFIEIKNLLER